MKENEVRGHEFERKQGGVWEGLEREKKRGKQCNWVLISKKF